MNAAVCFAAADALRAYAILMSFTRCHCRYFYRFAAAISFHCLLLRYASVAGTAFIRVTSLSMIHAAIDAAVLMICCYYAMMRRIAACHYFRFSSPFSPAAATVCALY